MPLVEQARQVTSPIAPCPSKALVQELSIVLQCCLDFAFRMVLHIRLPTMRNHPAGDEIVVIRVELILAEPPFLIGEASCELLILQNVRTIGDCTTRHARYPAIHVRSCSTVEIPSFEIQSAEEAIDSLRESWTKCSSKSLACHNSTKLLILKGSKHPQEGLAGPGDIVVRKDDDPGPDFRYSTCHLTPLIRLLDGHAPQPVVL